MESENSKRAEINLGAFNFDNKEINGEVERWISEHTFTAKFSYDGTLET